MSVNIPDPPFRGSQRVTQQCPDGLWLPKAAPVPSPQQCVLSGQCLGHSWLVFFSVILFYIGGHEEYVFEGMCFWR